MKKKGLVHIYTGDGKGKTTAAIGLAVRAAGAGSRVLFVQFFKEDGVRSGEKEFFSKAALSIELLRSNCRHPIFTKEKTDLVKVEKALKETFVMAKARAREFDLLVLDEIMPAINGGWIEPFEVISFLESRPEGLEVVLTGRDALPLLVQTADYVTEMLKIKHPFDSGTGAREGIEF